MAIIKCKMCGGDLNLVEGASTAECEYCGSVQTVPKVDDEKKLTLFARANRLRAACEFDKASGVYEAIVADFAEEAEAYWGLVLCKYGIEYVDDPATGKKIPTCHRSSFDSVLDDSDFEQALENADSSARKVYREEAKQLEEIRKGIIAVSANEEPYDIFICYKETDPNGDRTLDSVLAQDVYDALTDKGYRVFFSRITLEDKLGQEYEPYIFAALNSAKIMLAFGTDYEYFNAVWVKNEWSRFLKLMAKDKEKHLIPCYKGIDAYDMPKEFAKLQAQDLGKVGATQDLLRGIGKILPRQESVVAEVQKPVASASAMVMRGQFALDDGDWKKADEYFERALDENPEDGKAYLGKVLVGLRLSEPEQINDHFIKLEGDKNFERAIRFSTGAEKAKLEQIKETAEKKWLVKRLSDGLKKIAKIKEKAEITEIIKNYTAMGTVEAYERIVQLCEDSVAKGTNAAITQSTLASYRLKLNIMRFLSADLCEYSLERMVEMFIPVGTGGADSIACIETLVNDGSVIFDSQENTFFLASAKTEILAKRQKTRYEAAVAEMRAANRYTMLLLAAESFEKLGDYLDSAEKAAECRETAAQWQEAMEEERRAHEVRMEALRREQEKNAEKLRQEQEKRQEEQHSAFERRKAGLCQHCGGDLKGFFSKKCVSCGKPKDY